MLISQKTFAGTIATGARVFVWGACEGAKRLARVTVCGTVVATDLLDGQCVSSQDFTGYALQGLPLESYCADDQVLFGGLTTRNPQSRISMMETPNS